MTSSFQESPEPPQSDDPSAPYDAATVVTAMADAVLRGDTASALALISPEAIDHAPLPGAPGGHAGWLAKWAAFAEDSRGLSTSVRDRICARDSVATRYDITRSDTGAAVGFALEMIRVADGQVIEHWALPLPRQAG